VVLPVVVTYQLYAYRVFRRKAREPGISYGTSPAIHSRRTHEREPRLHIS
jgi:hypothetical protein